MLDSLQLRELIIKPALSKLNLYSESAVQLLLFTCAAETNGGEYLKQIGGPALGIYQIEPRSYEDLWMNYIKKRGDLNLIMNSKFNAPYIQEERRVIYDLDFATAVARIFYRRVQEALPRADDVGAIWAYYKKYWNTEKGAAERDVCIKKYRAFIGDKTITKSVGKRLQAQQQEAQPESEQTAPRD